MPLYEYQCEKCGCISEILISIKEADSELVCDECGGKLKRVFSVTADAHLSTSSSSASGQACNYGGG